MSVLAIVTLVRDNPDDLVITLGSIMGQDIGFVRVCVVDGSSPQIRPRIENICSDFGVPCVQDNRVGIYPAMNRGLEAVSDCDWVWFLNSGDRLFDREVIRRASEAIARASGSCDLLVGKAVGVRDDQLVVLAPTLNSYRLAARLGAFRAPHPSTVTRVSYLLGMGGFSTRWSVAADWEVALRAFFAHSMVAVDDFLSIHRLDGVSSKNLLIPMYEQSRVRAYLLGRAQFGLELVLFPVAVTLAALSRLQNYSAAIWRKTIGRKAVTDDVIARSHFCDTHESRWPDCCDKYLGYAKRGSKSL